MCIGYLVTGRSDFIADSLPEQDRALDGEHLASEVGPHSQQITLTIAYLNAYNPYDLGSVFAATVWEVADATR